MNDGASVTDSNSPSKKIAPAPAHLLPKLYEKLDLLHDYQKDHVLQFGQLEKEIKQGELMLARDMEMDPNEINIDAAAEIAILVREASSLPMNELLDASRVSALLLDSD